MLMVPVLAFLFSFQFSCVSSECPIAGCQPNRCYCIDKFTSVQPDPHLHYIKTPLKISERGCVANGNNIVCPLDTEVSDQTRAGCLALNYAATSWWKCEGLKQSISLPIVDITGQVIASDGYTLVAYNSTGGIISKPIKLFPNTGRLVDLVYTDNSLFEMIYKCGLIFASDTNGIPWASMWINNTAKANGTFVPLATPAISGERMYLLTGFWPTNASLLADKYIDIRLYAIDSTAHAVRRLRIAWYYEIRLQGYLPAIESNYKSCAYHSPLKEMGGTGTGVDDNIDSVAEVTVIDNTVVATLNYITSTGSVAHFILSLNDTTTSFIKNCANTVSDEVVVSLSSLSSSETSTTKHWLNRGSLFIKAVQKDWNQDSPTQLQIFNKVLACNTPIKTIDLSEILLNGTGNVRMTSKLLSIGSALVPSWYIMLGAVLSVSQEGYAVALRIDEHLRASVVWRFITPDKMPPVGQIAALQNSVIIYSTQNSILLLNN